MEASIANRRLGGIAGILSGILLFAIFAMEGVAFNGSAEEILAGFDGRRLAVGIELIVVLVFAFLVVVYFLALRTVLKREDDLLGGVAATLFIIAFVSVAFIRFFSTMMIIGLADAYARGGAQERAAAVVLTQALLGLDVPPLLFSTLGAGLLALGLAIRKNASLPRWVAYAGVVGGIALLFGWLFDLVHPPELFIIVQVFVAVGTALYFGLSLRTCWVAAVAFAHPRSVVGSLEWPRLPAGGLPQQ